MSQAAERRPRAAAGILLLLLSLAPVAQSAVLTATLGRWLDTEAAPALAETLSRHPKFSGETVQIVSLRDGRPVEEPSQLHQAVEAELTQLLLKRPGVKLAWDEPRGSCGVPRTLNYLLGIEIEAAGSNSHTLNIGMVDVAESVWVSGVSLSWRGRLTAAEKVALRSPVSQPPQGTVESPLPMTAISRIAELLSDSVRCSLPEGIAGDLYIEPTEDGALNRVRGELSRDLTLKAVAAVSAERQNADWLMRLSSRPIGNRTQELVLTLEDTDAAGSQQLASVFVVGLGERREQAREPDTSSIVAAVPLLSPMALHQGDHEGICRNGGERCVEVSFELNRDAYLFVLSTHRNELKASSCRRAARREEAGERRFRLRVPASNGANAGAGLYAIAVQNRSAARALANHIGNAPGTCAREPSRTLNTWLRQLDTLLGAYPDSVEWRAMHLAAGPNGVEAI